MNELKGKVAIVVGSSRGLGEASRKRFLTRAPTWWQWP